MATFSHADAISFRNLEITSNTNAIYLSFHMSLSEWTWCAYHYLVHQAHLLTCTRFVYTQCKYNGWKCTWKKVHPNKRSRDNEGHRPNDMKSNELGHNRGTFHWRNGTIWNGIYRSTTFQAIMKCNELHRGIYVERRELSCNINHHILIGYKTVDNV